jgi:3-oxoacyl-[acyl-carrier protein] reductase
MSATLTSRPVALITGGSRGIGKAITLSLARAGFFVAINFQSSEEKAQALLSEIEKENGEGMLLPFSVKEELSVKEGFAKLLQKTGRIDVLVNNAGVTRDGLLVRQKEEDIDAVLETNLRGVILCTREALSPMMKARKGSIVHLSSVVGLSGNAGQAVYSATKAGVIGFSKSMAKEMASRGIRSNVVAPGYIRTEMTEALTEKQKEDILRNIPLSQFGTPEDVADLVSFLVSDRAKYITGETISVNGGLYI